MTCQNANISADNWTKPLISLSIVTLYYTVKGLLLCPHYQAAIHNSFWAAGENRLAIHLAG